MKPEPSAERTVSPVELAQRVDDFCASLQGERSPATLGTYRRSLNEFQRWFGRQDASCRFSEEDIFRYREYLTEARGLQPASVSTYLTALRRFCGYLVDEGELTTNPATGVRGNSRPSAHSREALTEEEVERLLEEVDLDEPILLRDRAMMALMLFAGLSEIELVRADCADFEHTLLGRFLAVQAKGRARKDQQVPVEGFAADALHEYLIVRPRRRPSDPLFVGHGRRSSGQRMSTRSVRARINLHLTAAGIKRPGISPHSLVHTAPLLWLKDGLSVEEIKDRMRHGTLETTLISVAKQR